MKGKQLFILLVLATVAGVAWSALSTRGNAWSESAGGGAKVLEFPINEVAHLKIHDATGELNLVKKDDAWVVQERADYPASFKEVSEFLRKLWDLKTGQEVKVGPSQMSRLELVEPGKGNKTGTIVEISNAEGKTLTALLVGKKYGSKTAGEGLNAVMDVPKGRYVKSLNGTQVSLVSDPLDDAQSQPQRWLLKDFFGVVAPTSISVVGPNENQTWTMTRPNPNAEWQLADVRPEETADNSKAFQLSRLLQAPTFYDVLPPNTDPASTGLDKPTVAKISTFDGFHYELKIGRPTGGSFPFLVSVTADLARERTVGEGEKPEDKAKLDAEFAARQKSLGEKLAREQKFSARAFLVPQESIELLLQPRTAFLSSAKPAAP